ncbi:hypothetical protein IPG41_04340 [Candidatus Peregrinibacteria bacterium]|nr:MAG: hypothetical protein IPG41_04340 [Candidatus Peregrinibacteria bacterium]
MLIKLDPIKRGAAFLVLLSAFAFGYNASGQVALHLLSTVGFSLLLYSAYTWFLPNKHKNAWNTLITGLILFLILHYGVTWTDLIYPLTATFLAVSIKFFVEYKGSPIVNPAAASLLLAALVLAFVPGLDRPFVSWWGASFWLLDLGPVQIPLSLLLLLPWLIFGVPSWRRWTAVLSFFAVYFVGLLLRGQGLESVQFVFTDSMIYFYATVMLIEPKTSPFRPSHQLLYGAVAAALIHVLLLVHAPYPELFALVAANLGNATLRWKPTDPA